MFNLNREEYLKHYHKRSNVESTFSSLKRKFGGDVRSKTTLAMKNEVLAKVVCHDITCVIRTPYEIGIAPSVLPVPYTANDGPAHIIPFPVRILVQSLTMSNYAPLG